MEAIHIINRCLPIRGEKKSNKSHLFSLALILSLSLSTQICLTEAIVKQSSAQIPTSTSQQHQARNDDQSSSIIGSGSSSSFQPSSGVSGNGQSSSGSQYSSSSSSGFQPSGHSSSSASSSNGSPSSSSSSQLTSSGSSSFIGLNSINSGSSAGSSSSSAGSPVGQSASALPSSASSSSSSSLNNKQPTYYDGLSASASDTSYQAAANSVNAALASYANSQAAAAAVAGNSPSAAGSSSSSGSSASQTMQYQPVHYLYYPGSKSGSSSSSIEAQAKSSPLSSSSSDPMSASSSAYPSYASYADQFAAIQGLNGNQQQAADQLPAASNQDSSFLPQPNQGSNNDNLYNGQHQTGYGQQPQLNNGPMMDPMSAYGNQLNPTHVPSPTSMQPQVNQAPHQHQQGGNVQFQTNSNPNLQQQQQSANNQNQDFLNSYNNQVMQASASQQQQQQQNNLNNNQIMGANNGMFNQMGDLYTSNFGSSSLSAPVASYMSPNNVVPGPHVQQQQQQQNNIQDPFGQLDASHAIPHQHQQQPQHQHQQHMQQQQSNIFATGNGQQNQQAAGGSSLFNNPYLSSLLQSPQFASQFAQATSAITNGLNNNGVDGQMLASGSQPASSVTAAAASSGSGSKKFGISSFIMPMLALAGLSLLIPTMSNIGTAVGRKKRSIGEERSSLIARQQQILYESMNGLANQLAKETAIGEYLEKIERYYKLYENATQNDDCMNRLICEFGDSVKDMSGKNAVIMIVEKLVPQWMVGKVHLFKEAAMDAKEGREKCQKYSCQHDKHHDKYFFKNSASSSKKQQATKLN